MQPSIIGLLMAIAIYLIDRWLGGRLVIGLMVSLAFGATAWITLTAIGGSSPVIYTLFGLALLVKLLLRTDLLAIFSKLLSIHRIGWVILLLSFYVIAGAAILPRLFAGDTTVMVVGRGLTGKFGILPMPLAPTTGNISQAGYFVLSAVIYFTVLAIAIDANGLRRIRIAAFGWAIAVALTGTVNLVGMLAGLGDLLMPVRTAAYFMLTGEGQAISGLPRISGAFSEASAFANMAVPACIFVISYWRVERRPEIFALAGLLFILVLLSTSTTAYVAISVCVIWFGLVNGISLLKGRLATADAVLFGLAILAVTFLVAAYLFNEGLFEPFFRMIETVILNKSASSSALERGMWNAQALRAFLDTSGLGVGIGSTQTSSWLVAVPAQLGWIGAVAMFATLLVLIRGLVGLKASTEDRSAIAVAAGCRAAALVSIVAVSVNGASPDPGVLYFFALATVVATRYRIAFQSRGEINPDVPSNDLLSSCDAVRLAAPS